MFVYYVYSFQDAKAENTIMEMNRRLANNGYRPFWFTKENPSLFWKITARKKIKMSDLVIFFVSKHYSQHQENINYELKLARKYNKTIMYVKTDEADPPAEYEKYNKTEYPVGSMSLDEAVSYIRSNYHEYSTERLVFENKEKYNMTPEDKQLLFKQYQEMFASTESLMSRRQNTSSFYISINTVLFAMIAAVVTLGLDMEFLCAFCVVISVFGIVMSKTWLDTLESYDRINYSKFNVLESMERYLPASMFAAEYKDTKNTLMMKSVPSYSKRERKIPKMFMALYSLLAIFLVIILILSFCDLITI